jgi:malate permease and related proteins
MNQANNAFLITFSLVVFGYAIKKGGFFTEKEGRILSKFIMHTTFPTIVLLLFMRLRIEAHLFLLPLMSLLFGGTLLTIAWYVFRTYANVLRGVLIMGAGGLNTVMFALPIIEGIWGRDALPYLIMFDMGNTLVAFALIYPIGSYFSALGEPNLKFVLKKIIRLPPLQGMFIGLVINILHIPIPTIATDALEIIAKANKPLVLILMGIYLNFVFEKQQFRDVSKVLMIRYTIGLSVVGLLYTFMSPCIERSVLIVLVVAPVGLTVLPFSDEFQYDTRIAGLMVNLSMIISFVLMWALVLGLGLF